jgi:uncharacterized LabA/DUF88 family protein
MIFIDFENFNIALIDHYRKLGTPTVRLDYNTLPLKLVERLPGVNNRLIKTFLFAPKPDGFLMQDTRRKATYDWINGLKNQKYFTVIEGQHLARPVSGLEFTDMDINKPGSFYVVEKGTDVNMAAHLITKGLLHAYDTALLVSGDSDYIPIMDILNTIGKTTVSIGVKGQNLSRLREHSDDIMLLDRAFFDTCSRS